VREGWGGFLLRQCYLGPFVLGNGSLQQLGYRRRTSKLGAQFNRSPREAPLPSSSHCAVSTRFGGASLTFRSSRPWPTKGTHRLSIFSVARLITLKTTCVRDFSSRPMECAKTRRRGMERHSSVPTSWSIGSFRIPIWSCGSSKDTRSVGLPW